MGLGDMGVPPGKGRDWLVPSTCWHHALSPQLLTREFWGDSIASRSLPATVKESKAEPRACVGSTLISAQVCWEVKC